MVFNVMVAGDVDGVTHNFEYAFPTLPTLGEVKAQVETVFGRELPEGIPALRADKLQVYDEAAQDWVELVTGRQLSQGCQVFVFFAPPPPPQAAAAVSATPAAPPQNRPQGDDAAAAVASPHSYHHHHHTAARAVASRSPEPLGACGHHATATPAPAVGSPGPGHVHGREHVPAAGSMSAAAAAAGGEREPEAPKPAAPAGTPGPAIGAVENLSAQEGRNGSGSGSAGGSSTVCADAATRARVTFDLMDHGKTRRVHRQHLHDLFQKLRLHVADDVVDGLFTRAENSRGNAGYFTYTEWSRIHNHYPRLSETLYARAQQLDAEAAAKDNLAAQQDVCRNLQHTADEKRRAYHACLDAAEDQRRKVMKFRDGVDRCQAAADEAQGLEAAIRRDKDAAQAELADAHADREHAQGSERERAKVLEDAQGESQQGEQAMADDEAAAIQVRERIRQLDRELELARKELTRIEDARAERHRVLQQRRRAEQAARDALAEAQAGVQRACDTVVKVQDNLCKIDVAIRESAGQARNAQHELVLSQQGHEAEVRELQHLEARARESSGVMQTAEGDVAAQVARIEALHGDVDGICRVLSQTADGDGRLIEDEYQLRAQREALETQEARLGDLHTWLAARRTPGNSRSHMTSGSGGSGDPAVATDVHPPGVPLAYTSSLSGAAAALAGTARRASDPHSLSLLGETVTGAGTGAPAPPHRSGSGTSVGLNHQHANAPLPQVQTSFELPPPALKDDQLPLPHRPQYRAPPRHVGGVGSGSASTATAAGTPCDRELYHSDTAAANATATYDTGITYMTLGTLPATTHADDSLQSLSHALWTSQHSGGGHVGGVGNAGGGGGGGGGDGGVTSAKSSTVLAPAADPVGVARPPREGSGSGSGSGMHRRYTDTDLRGVMYPPAAPLMKSLGGRDEHGERGGEAARGAAPLMGSPAVHPAGAPTAPMYTAAAYTHRAHGQETQFATAAGSRTPRNTLRDPPLSPRPVSVPSRAARPPLSELPASTVNALATSPAARPPAPKQQYGAGGGGVEASVPPGDLSPGTVVRGLAAAVTQAKGLAGMY